MSLAVRRRFDWNAYAMGLYLMAFVSALGDHAWFIAVCWSLCFQLYYLSDREARARGQ